MPWSGSSPNRSFTRTTGTFTGSTAWAQEDAAGVKVVATKFDTHDQDLAEGINTCLARDGGNSPTANINFGGFKITNLADPTSAQDVATKAYVDGAVLADGDKGDVTVSGSGATWTIDNSAVTATKIADNAITTNKIATNSVTGAKLASNSVSTANIVDANVTEAKLSSGLQDTINNRAWTLIGELNPNAASAPYAITGLSGYSQLRLFLDLRFSVDGEIYLEAGHSTAWLTGGSDYSWIARVDGIGGGFGGAVQGSLNTNRIKLSGNEDVDASASETFISEIGISSFQSTSHHKMVTFHTGMLNINVLFESIIGTGQVRDAANALTRLRVGNTGGGTITGRIIVEGRTS